MWGHVVGTIDLCEVLREHDTALQFLGTGVSAMREVYNSSLIPPLVPMSLGILVILVVFIGWGLRGIWTIGEVLGCKSQYIASGR